MAIYRISRIGPEKKQKQMKKLAETTFKEQNMVEQDVQDLLMQDGNIAAIAPGVLVVCEKYNKWEGSQREMDLLGVDHQANLVVIELKRVKDGGHMELQAIRYASMIQSLSFDELVDVYAEYESISKSAAEAKLLRHFDWNEPNREEFGENVKIILASADFNSELATSVLWLNEKYNMDIRCVRMCPYQDLDSDKIFLDIQTIIPLSEAEDYQRIRAKKETIRREAKENRIRYNIKVGGKSYENQPLNRMMFHFIAAALRANGTPKQIREFCKAANKSSPLKDYEGKLDSEEMAQKLQGESKEPRILTRFYIRDDQLIYKGGRTYAVSAGWDSESALPVIAELQKKFPELKIEYKQVGN